MSTLKRLIVLFALSGAAYAGSGPLLNPVFQDHAVIQRAKPVPLWGQADPHASVAISFAGSRVTAIADASGKWRATMPALSAGGPYELTVRSATQSQTVQDILIGDVYLCSGQSNMEMPVRVASNYDVDIESATNQNVRLLKIGRFASITPQANFATPISWMVTSPASVRDFSAACYYFGRELQPKIGVPIGLIESAWGGSTIQAWLPMPALDALGWRSALDIQAEYSRNKTAAEDKWNDVTDNWWRAHDPASSSNPPWWSPAYDDSNWAEIVPAGNWESWGNPALANFDGVVWFRKKVVLSAGQVDGEATLDLGPIDDIDTTWVNGVHVGTTAVYDAKRHYKIPKGVLHQGENVIAVGVLDVGAGGGMWGPAAEKRLIAADGAAIPLDKPWRWRISADVRQTGTMQLPPWTANTGLAMLHNGMINPLGPIALTGIVWYQGETNATDAVNYGKYLQALIGVWRDRFGPDTAFLNVQLPAYGPQSNIPTDSNWARLREQQRVVSDQTSRSGLAVTIDLGQRDNIHPTDKQNVGLRLSLIARKLIYGQDVVSTGPRPLAAVRARKTITVSFDQDLAIRESNRPLGFQLCSEDKCSFADARLDGRNVEIANTLVGAKVVKFCWADSPICNVYNASGLPAIPFRVVIAPGRKK